MTTVGKRVHDYLYIHIDAIEFVGNEHKKLVEGALARIPLGHPNYPNIAKINVRSDSVSLLSYPRFETEAFPELDASWTFPTVDTKPPVLRLYDGTLNPPILHRKELLIPPADERRIKWREITNAAEALGLFENPSTIGFKLNWEKLIESRGFQFIDSSFVPIGNAISISSEECEGESGIARHLTALTRSSLSAPIQLLIKHGLLTNDKALFDYGCGKGGDVSSLCSQGYIASGWDPYFAPFKKRQAAKIVNLGFVINVIENSIERVEALQKAFSLAEEVLAVSVMLQGNDTGGLAFADGVLTTRRTFQKYFSQGELKDFIEQVLHQPAFMVAPGIAFVFADKEQEQRFAVGRHRRSNDARVRRLRPPMQARPPRVRPHKEPTPSALRLERARPVLEALWLQCLDLGRWPEAHEIENLAEVVQCLGSVKRAVRLLKVSFDLRTLEEAARERRDDLLIYFVTHAFERRQQYRKLDRTLQLDVKAFFGDYRAAQDHAHSLIRMAAEPATLLQACKKAAEQGFGNLDNEHSLQIHLTLVERLPAVLRAYVQCGLILWDSTSDVQLVKIHISSGKLTLLEFDDFDSSPLPLLRRRIKINVRRLRFDIFEYGSSEYPKLPLFWKSRYINEDFPDYAQQFEFDESLERQNIEGLEDLSPRAFRAVLAERRLEVQGMRLIDCTTPPDINSRCGRHFSYRDFIECGDTQKKTGIKNIPAAVETYNALYRLATDIIDPVIDYFGSIRLTYGFCSANLAKAISKRVAPKLDQHASYECNSRGSRICTRGGAACDFIVEHEDMEEVAAWIASNLPFDRIYTYGKATSIHVSAGPDESREVFRMSESPRGKLTPVRLRLPGQTTDD